MGQVDVTKVASAVYHIEEISAVSEDCWREVDVERLAEIISEHQSG